MILQLSDSLIDCMKNGECNKNIKSNKISKKGIKLKFLKINTSPVSNFNKTLLF